MTDPADPGGATNKGVTQAVYDNWRKRAFDPDGHGTQMKVFELNPKFVARDDSTKKAQVWFDPSEPARHPEIAYSLLVGYLGYSLVIAGLVWRSGAGSERDVSRARNTTPGACGAASGSTVRLVTSSA
mgnify:CR=1 FL=1